MKSVQGSVKSFYKGTISKYFRLCGPRIRILCIDAYITNLKVTFEIFLNTSLSWQTVGQIWTTGRGLPTQGVADREQDWRQGELVSSCTLSHVTSGSLLQCRRARRDSTCEGPAAERTGAELGILANLLCSRARGSSGYLILVER